MSKVILESHSEAETEHIGEQIGRQLKSGDVVLLHANLGAGKTVLSRGIARGLGIEEAISSPTFAIVQEYETPRRMYHIDLYRLDDIYAATSFGIEDYIEDPDAVSIIEWPSRIQELIDDSMINIKINYTASGRELIIDTERLQFS